jgi:hypothetical protein
MFYVFSPILGALGNRIKILTIEEKDGELE